MSEARLKRIVTVRAIRGDDPGEDVDEWASATPEQRMNGRLQDLADVDFLTRSKP